MVQDYDVIIVGAGDAGLAAALELILAGRKVLMVEKHNIPGGCASSFRRGRFEFEPSLHELCAVGSEENPYGVRKMFNEFGVKAKWCHVPDTFRVISHYKDGRELDVTMPSGKKEFIDAMEKYAPGSRKGMEKLFSICEEIEDAVNYVGDHGVKDPAYILKTFPNFIRCSAYFVNEVLDSLKLPEDAKEILGTYWSYLGVDCDHLLFMHYAIMVYMYIETGAYIPKDVSHALSLALASRFEELGGILYYNTLCTEILFDENKKACGISTTRGVFHAKHILFNGNPTMAYAHLIPQEILPEKAIQLSRAREYCARPLVVYLGISKSHEELGIHDYTVILPVTMDTVKEYESLKSFETNNFVITNCLNVVNPEASPEGTCILSLTTLYMSDVWNNIAPEDYTDFKNKMADHFISVFEERTGIHIRDFIEEIEISTPWTFHRYVHLPEGAIYGYSTRSWDNILARILMEKEDHAFEGLDFIGGSSLYGDGYSVCYSNGQTKAREINELLEAEKHE